MPRPVLFGRGRGSWVRIEWKSKLHGVERCPADLKLLGEGESAGTFGACVAIFGTPDRPGVRQWLTAAADEDFRRMLQALDVTVTVAPDRAEIAGSLPVSQGSPDSGCQNDMLTTARTSA